MPDDATAADELSAPLGRTPRRKRRFALPRALPWAVAVGLAAMPLAFLVWIVTVDDPLGGEPVAIASTAGSPQAGSAGRDDAAKARKKAATTPNPADTGATSAEASPAGGNTVTIINGMSGQRQQVTIAPAAPPQGAPPPIAAPTEPKAPAEVDSKLLEKSRHGLIPAIAPNGVRPADAYARRAEPAAADGRPRVAIVVGRLGVSASMTTQALAKLPGPVTLAFTPYGADLERWAARARSEGHEVLMQAPMEPFDYPDNDPGPRALLASLTADQNVDRLHWCMSRMQGYVGIGNYMGARLLSNEPAVTAIMREAAKRGLIYFDDGTAHGLAGQIAGANNVPFAKADVVIDATPTATAIDAALARLEAVARERGLAVGSASALPVSIERIAEWSKAAEKRGILLAPITAAASRPRSS
jgi:polysaccharide deacetylase 2 family uncharacterized protein YibQ